MSQVKCGHPDDKPTRYLGRTLVKTKEEYNFGVDASYVESMLEEFNMSALKSSPTLRSERREKDENEMFANNRKATDSLLENCYGLVGLTCAVRRGKPHQALDVRATHSKSILRYLCGNPGIMTVRPTTLTLEAVKRAAVLTCGDSDRAGDADGFIVR